MNLEELLKSLGLDDEAIGKVVEATKPDQDQAEEIERLRKHNETLLGEKKAESEKRRAEQAEKDRLAEETARKKAILRLWKISIKPKSKTYKIRLPSVINSVIMI